MQKIKEFLQGTAYEHFDIEVASSDASFRRYFRLTSENETLVIMDSSLEKSSLEPFIKVTNLMLSVNVHAPKIIYEDTKYTSKKSAQSREICRKSIGLPIFL